MLYEAYEPRCYYFECVECLRRLALTGFLLVLAPGSTAQIVAACMIAVITTSLYGVMQPFDKQTDDNLFVFAQLMCFFQVLEYLAIRVPL